jgi:FG-GAP-like repeat
LNTTHTLRHHFDTISQRVTLNRQPATANAEGTRVKKCREHSLLPIWMATLAAAIMGAATFSAIAQDSVVVKLYPNAAASAPRLNDLNGDDKSDLILENVDGRTAAFLMNGLTTTASTLLFPSGSATSVRFTGDFDGDGKQDLITENTAGDWKMVLMDGLVAKKTVALYAGSDYCCARRYVTHVGDFDGDGVDDLLWILRFPFGGEAFMTLMNETGITEEKYIGLPHFDSLWRASRVGDFDGDGKSDIVFQRGAQDDTFVVLMDGTEIAETSQLMSAPYFTHVADLNGDGTSDLIAAINGRVVAYLMEGGNVVSYAEILGANSGWHLTHVGDINGDGKDDLVLKHAQGRTRALMMDGFNVINKAEFGPGSNWTVTQLADFNGDGRKDAIFQSDTGALELWLLNGARVLGSTTLQPPGSGWTTILRQ